MRRNKLDCRSDLARQPNRKHCSKIHCKSDGGQNAHAAFGESRQVGVLWLPERMHCPIAFTGSANAGRLNSLDQVAAAFVERTKRTICLYISDRFIVVPSSP